MKKFKLNKLNQGVMFLLMFCVSSIASADYEITKRGPYEILPCQAKVSAKRGEYLDAPADIVTVSLGKNSNCNAVNVYGETIFTEVFVPKASSIYSEDYKYRVVTYIKPGTPISFSIKGWDGWDVDGPIAHVNINLETLDVQNR